MKADLEDKGYREDVEGALMYSINEKREEKGENRAKKASKTERLRLTKGRKAKRKELKKNLLQKGRAVKVKMAFLLLITGIALYSFFSSRDAQ